MLGMTYPIQSNVPKPLPAREARRRKYPFREMEVGDMFFVPSRTTNTLMNLASREGRALGRKFSTRLCWMRSTPQGWVECLPDADGAVQGIGTWRER